MKQNEKNNNEKDKSIQEKKADIVIFISDKLKEQSTKRGRETTY